MSQLLVSSINNAAAPSGGLVFGADGKVSGAGLDLLVVQSFSAVSTVSVDNCFTSDYDNYLIAGTIKGSANTALRFRLRAAASDITTSNYFFQLLGASSTSLVGGRQTGVNIRDFGEVNTTLGMFDFFITSPALAEVTSGVSRMVTEAATAQFVQYGGCFNSTDSADGFTLIPASGTITGMIRVYGYRN